MHFFSLFIFSAFVFAINLLFSPSAFADDMQRFPEKPTQSVYFAPATNGKMENSATSDIDRAKSPDYEKELSQNTNRDIFANNINFTYDHILLQTPAYLNFSILDNINSSFLVQLAPDKYSTFDMQSRSRLPINRYNSSVNMNKSFYTDDSDMITAALFDFIFGALTQNIFSMNFNFIALKDDPNGINMNFVLKPSKNIMFKYSRIEVTKDKESIYEIQLIPTATTLLTWKTTDNGRSTSTGFEFEMKF